MSSKILCPLLLLFFITSCLEKPDFEDQLETQALSMSQVKVLANHDLRSARVTNVKIRLSDEFVSDSYIIFIKKRDKDRDVLIYQGSISKGAGLEIPLKLGSNTKEIVITIGSANGVTRVIRKENSDDILIEPDFSSAVGVASKNSSKVSSPPPSSECSLYSEFNGNDNGSYKISGNSTAGINVSKSTSIYICNGATWTPAYINGSQKKLYVYVTGGGTLNLSSSTVGMNIYNEGNLQATSDFNVGLDGLVENWGTVSVSGNTTVQGTIRNYAGTITSNAVNVNGGGSVYNDGEDNGGATFVVNGALQVNQLFHNKVNSTLTVSGQLKVNGGAQFYNYCKTTIGKNVQNNGKVHLYDGSYTGVDNGWTNNGGATHKLFDGAYLSVGQISSNTSIIGEGTYSVIETGSISFNYGNKFKGSIDVCSGSYTSSMGNSSIISTCTTVIPVTSCSIGINSVIDIDGDCIPADQDVDDNNANVASYNYPQGEGSFFTSIYEDLWPCEGDFDFNDVVHNYSYREGWNSGCNASSSQLKELNFTYKFPALGGGYNNALVLRVIDTDDDANVSLDANASYSEAKITRLHDDVNQTTSFVFSDLKSLYSAGAGTIINTQQRNYAEIPVLTGSVIGMDGDYDEYVLIDGVSGNELHHTTDENLLHYGALNEPTKFNTDKFGQCNDRSNESYKYINENGLPWAITDIPIEWEWPKEFIQLTEAYPDFATFATSNPELDWYSESSSKVTSKIFQD